MCDIIPLGWQYTHLPLAIETWRATKGNWCLLYWWYTSFTTLASCSKYVTYTHFTKSYCKLHYEHYFTYIIMYMYVISLGNCKTPSGNNVSRDTTPAKCVKEELPHLYTPKLVKTFGPNWFNSMNSEGAVMANFDWIEWESKHLKCLLLKYCWGTINHAKDLQF